MAIGHLIHKHLPDFENLTRDVLFGQAWQDARLTKRDRSLATVAMMLVLRAEGPLAGHMQRALAHGVTPDELRALVTHAGFYGGWACVEQAVKVMEEIQLGSVPDGKPCAKLCCPGNAPRKD